MKKTNFINIIYGEHFRFTEYNEMGWSSEWEIDLSEKNYVVHKDYFANKHENKTDQCECSVLKGYKQDQKKAITFSET